MKTTKVSITIPKEIVEIIDALSKQKGLSRSRYISNVLREKVMFEKERVLKEKYDKIFSDDKISKEQLNATNWSDGSDVLDGKGW